MTTNQLLLVLLGLTFGGGLALLLVGLQKVEPTPRHSTSLADDVRRILARTGRRLPAALGVALLVLVLTWWPVLAVASGALVFFFDKLFGGAAAEKLAHDRLEGLAMWTESLRDTIAGAVGLEQAIPASEAAAAPTLKPAIRALADRLRVRVPLPVALLQFADEIDDSAADLVVASLVLNARLRGPGLRDVLSSLARSVRNEVEMRGRIMASRRSTRRSVQIVIIVTVVFVVGLRVFNPGYVEPYGTAMGQVVLTLVVGIFVIGLLWLRRLSAFEGPQRFLDAGAALAERAATTRGPGAARTSRPAQGGTS